MSEVEKRIEETGEALLRAIQAEGANKRGASHLRELGDAYAAVASTLRAAPPRSYYEDNRLETI